MRAEIIVVDNGSTDDSGDVGRHLGCRVLVVPDLPVSALRNLAASSAAAPILAFVDADHEIATGWADAALEVLTGRAAGAVGYPYSPPSNPTWVQRLYDGLRTHPTAAQPARWVGSGNMAVTAAAFRGVGGFDPTLEACEDVDLCIRLRVAGARLTADPRLACVHHGDPATLRALFRSELWRGRDNLRVSLRERLTMRSVPSIAIPIGDLACLATLPVALALNRPWLGIAAAAAVLLPSLARTAVIARRTGLRGIGWHLRAFAVALTYDGARALALLLRARHRRARQPVTVAMEGS